ncbi:hypothetical protein [Glycomyces sp. MUSA5-2]|uniref:hypothetical protein n=1 Tax=Glycomyces sp. MUSA5-2 TaxID=2053002 RepID=UPI00300A5146
MELLFLIVLLPLLLAEVGEVSPWAARRLIRWAARLLGERGTVERFSEEWEAELEAIPGKLLKLGYALGRVLLLPLTLRELRAVSIARGKPAGAAARRGGITAEEYADLVRQHHARLGAYGIDHFQVLGHGKSVLVHFIDGRVEETRDPEALEALVEDLRSYARRNPQQQDTAQGPRKEEK